MQHVKFKLFRDTSLNDLEKELNEFVCDKDVINGKLCSTETDARATGGVYRDVEYTIMLAYRDLADAERDPRPRR